MLGHPEQVPKAGKAKHGDHIEGEDRGNGVTHVGLIGANYGVGGGDGGGSANSSADPDERVQVAA